MLRSSIGEAAPTRSAVMADHSILWTSPSSIAWVVTGVCMLLVLAQQGPRVEVLRDELAEIEGLAKELYESGKMHGAAVATLDSALEAVERDIEKLEASEGHELYFMASILRGTIYQQSSGLSDEQVEKKKNAYTFSNPRFWHNYYEKSQAGSHKFDWYGTWDTEVIAGHKKGLVLGDLIRPYLDTESTILMLGCGRSDMSEKMYRSGFERIVNVDVSDTLLESLKRELSSEMPGMIWKKMNASSLNAEDASFDAIIDKGTLDALQENVPLLEAAISEAHRTLRPGGYFISVTDMPAHIRVADQLGSYAYWEACQTHTAHLQMSSKGATDLQVHTCRRPHNGLWARVWSVLIPSPWPSLEL